MKAETAYNVIQALSDSEKKRLYRMLKTDLKNTDLTSPRKVNKNPLMTKAQTREYLLAMFERQRIRRENLK